MENITLPTKVDIQTDKDSPNEATIIIEPLYPGYGVTIGNALRRVLLSSMPGAAATAIKIKGVSHEFSTIPNVKEDVVNIILNLKQLRVKVFEEGESPINIKVSGKKKFLAKDIETPSSVEIASKNLHLFTTTDEKADVEITVWVSQGRGYEPVEVKDKEKYEVGVIAIDSIFTPVLNVAFNVENVRVGQRTDYDKLTLKVKTDGVINPEEALCESSKILVNHFQFLTEGKKEEIKEPAEATLIEESAIEEKIESEPKPEEVSEAAPKEAEEPEEAVEEKPKRGRPKKT